MRQSLWWALILVALPIGACIALISLQMHLRVTYTCVYTPLNEITKRILDIQTDASKTFTGFATALIGALGYYVKTRRTDFADFSRYTQLALVAALLGCILSIYFGQVWISNIVDELHAGCFDPTSIEVAKPQVLQYITFIVSLCWSATLIVARETVRIVPKEDKATT